MIKHLTIVGMSALVGSIAACGSQQFLPEGRDAHILADRMEKLKHQYNLPPGHTGVVVSFEESKPREKDLKIRSAYCYKGVSKITGAVVKREIIFNRMVWERKTQKQKDITLIHEMGHCLYDLTHYPDNIMTGDGTDEKDLTPMGIAKFKQRVKENN